MQSWIIWKKDTLIQLGASKSNNAGMFNDLLDKIKDFKYQNYFKNLVKKIQRQWNWILFQFNSKNSDK